MKLAYENLAICNVSSHYGQGFKNSNLVKMNDHVVNVGNPSIRYRLGDAGFSTANWSLQCAGKSSREIFLQCAFNESKEKEGISGLFVNVSLDGC